MTARLGLFRPFKNYANDECCNKLNEEIQHQHAKYADDCIKAFTLGSRAIQINWKENDRQCNYSHIEKRGAPESISDAVAFKPPKYDGYEQESWAEGE